MPTKTELEAEVKGLESKLATVADENVDLALINDKLKNKNKKLHDSLDAALLGSVADVPEKTVTLYWDGNPTSIDGSAPTRFGQALYFNDGVWMTEAPKSRVDMLLTRAGSKFSIVSKEE